ncbi:MAG: phage tail protein [Bacteroidetes bacterium]|nr:phage tail protein [Bacteroidota bacterium]
MNFFKKKNTHNISTANNHNGRRNFMLKSLAALFGASVVAKPDNIFAAKSKTGYIYVKRNGEIIEDYIPQGGSEPFLGSILMAGFGFYPVNYVYANGALLPIMGNEALFILIGTTYGGDGVSNFGLPDLRGRVPMHQGQGSGLSSYVIGQSGGNETVVLTSQQIPSHSHTINVTTSSGTSGSPAGNFIAQNADGIDSYSNTANSTLPSGSLGVTGSNQGHTNLQPFLTINFCIAVQGVFPTGS